MSKKIRMSAALIMAILMLSACSTSTQEASTSTVPFSQSEASAATSTSQGTEEDTVLTVVEGTPNPTGNLDELYLIQGDSLNGMVSFDDTTSLLPAADDTATNTLNLYHQNDLHGNVMTYSGSGDTHNVAQMKQLVDTAREERPEEAFLWISAGDDHMGSKTDELLGADADSFVQSAPYTAYSAAGLDFAGLGNHEFDKGTEVLSMAIQNNADFTVLNSNIFGSQFDLGTSVAAVGVTNGLRIGVIGVNTITETLLSTDADPGVYGISPVEATEKLVPLLSEFCDMLVVISHNGYEGSDRYTIAEGDASIAQAAAALTELPVVVVGGHTHTVLNSEGLEDENVYDGVPVLQAGQYGQNLGNLTATLTEEGAQFEARLIPMISGKENDEGTPVETEDDYDVEFQETVIEPLNVAVEEKMLEYVGQTDDTELLSVETTNADRYVGEAAMANYLNDAIVARSETFTTGPVDFSIFNSTGVSGLPLSSEITYNDIYTMFPYADTMYVVEMTGQNLKDIIENNAPRAAQAQVMLDEGEDPAGFIEVGYLNFSEGIRYQMNDGVAENITLNGEAIDDVLDETYSVALSSYLAIGRGGWQGEAVGQGLPDDFIGYDISTLCAENGIDLGLLFRNEIVEYIRVNSDGQIGADTGVIKDGRVEVVS